MTLWREAAITGYLEQVPGIGPANAEKLRSGEQGAQNQVCNTYQLFAIYLSMKTTIEEDGSLIDTKELNNKFWYWLKAKEIQSFRSGIVRVSLCCMTI